MADDREPLTSEEMIRQARGKVTESSEDLLRQAKESVSEVPDIEGLENIAVDIPVADEFPEPIPQIQTSRPRRVRRQRTEIPQGPISRDSASRVTAMALAAVILLIAIGVFVAVAASAP
ncbi:MAG TPA: hypothetical protein VK960_00150 [Acidimicrobiia bacterium]|nr:hypothetical protein [Acidimicrobiia bacterium]